MPLLLWRVQMFGGLRVVPASTGDASPADSVITRFRSQKIGALLAYLALNRGRAHAREELADLFWPDGDLEAGRQNLRTALASLRRQLEPPGIEAGSVLVSDGRSQVRLHPETVSADAGEFEHRLTVAGRASTAPEDRLRLLTEAAELYRGPLLPGFYETWALSERDRLQEAYQHALKRLIQLYAQAGETARAADWARRAVAADPLREEAQAALIRLLMASGERAAAQRHYDEAVRLLDEQLGIEPSSELKNALKEGASGVAAPPVPVSEPVTVPPLSPGKLDLPPSDFATAPASPAPGAPRVATQTLAAPAPPVHLPLTLTRFFGREGEIAAVTEILGDPLVRLVTLTGPGGSGKTRLAVETARRLTLGAEGVEPVFTGGAWFVPLAEVREGARIADALLSALGLTRSPAVPAEEMVADFLNASGRPVLLVLDNFEQLVEVEGAAEAVASLMAAVPLLDCLITSRQRLLLDGEREISVLPLPTPGAGARVLPGTPERLMEFPSVQLFVDRAQAARPDFQLNARNAEAVAALCVKLEGIPLAIELAAAWSQTLTPVQLLERLGNSLAGGQQARFDLLVSRRRGGAPRHATLRGALDWSYRMLPPELQAFFDRLSVFREGWTLEAAELVTEEPDRALPFLSELRDRSMVFVEVVEDDLRGAAAAAPADTDEDAPPEYVRFRMLETLREFAEERMGEAPTEERAALARRHYDYYLRLTEVSNALSRGPHQLHYQRLLEAEHSNVRAALRYALEDPAAPPHAAAQLIGHLWWFWMRRGYYREGRELLEQVLARAPELPAADTETTLLYVSVMSGIMTLGYFAADYDAVWENTERSGRLLDALGDAAPADAVSFVLFNRALKALNDVDMREGPGSPRALPGAKAALNVAEAALAHAERAGDPVHIARTFICVTTAHFLSGDPAAARDAGLRGLVAARQTRDPWEQSNLLATLAVAERCVGDFASVRARYREIIDLCRGIDSAQALAWSLWGVAGADLHDGQAERAARLLGAADRQLEILRTQLPLIWRFLHEQDVEAARAALGEEAFAALFAEGRSLSLDQALALALAVE